MTTTSHPKTQESTEIGQEVIPGMRLRAICRGHSDFIGRIAWSPCGRFIASPSQDRTVCVWDARGGKCQAVLEGHHYPVPCVAWSVHGKYLMLRPSKFEGHCPMIRHGCRMALMVALNWSVECVKEES